MWDLPDIDLNYNNPSNLEILGSKSKISNGLHNLDSLKLPPSSACGPGFVMAVLFSQESGQFMEYTSKQTEIACPKNVEIQLQTLKTVIKSKFETFILFNYDTLISKIF